ncbi:MAG: CRISPR-associated protein Csx16, partial [Burkholderiales bacterium]
MATWFISRHPGAKAWAAEQGLHIDQHLAHLDTALIQY